MLKQKKGPLANAISEKFINPVIESDDFYFITTGQLSGFY